MNEALTYTAEDLKPFLNGRHIDDVWSEYERTGYVIFPSLMDDGGIQRVRNALVPYLNQKGRNDFEGFKSNRVYALLAKNPDDRFQTATQLVSQLKKYVRRLKPITDTTHSFAPLPELAAAKKKTSPLPFLITGVAIVASGVADL